MRNYYVLLDFTPLLYTPNYEKEHPYLFNMLVDENISIFPDDRGFFHSELKNFDTNCKVYNFFNYDFDHYANLNIGDVLSMNNLAYLNNFPQIIMPYHEDRDIRDIFYSFGIYREDCKIVSLEALTSYFMEIFEDFDGKIIKNNVYSSIEDNVYTFLAELNIDERIEEFLNDKNSLSPSDISFYENLK